MTKSTGTHFSSWGGKRVTRSSGFPTDPEDGQEFYNTTDDKYYRYHSDDDAWYGADFTTSTSTSSSTTTTSTSTSSTSTSTSTTTSTTTSTSTSTTTTI